MPVPADQTMSVLAGHPDLHSAAAAHVASLPTSTSKPRAPTAAADLESVMSIRLVRLDQSRTRDHAGYADTDESVTPSAPAIRRACRRGLGPRVWPPLLFDDLSRLVEDDPETFRTPDINADTALTHDSARTFSSRTVLRIRTSARRLTKPGNGTTRSMIRS